MKNLVYKYIVIVLVLAIVSLLYVSFETLSDSTQIWFLDVGQGDSIVVITPHNKLVVIDGGLHDDVLFEMEKILPISTNKIDYLFVTHAHADHIGGTIQLLQKYTVDHVFVNAIDYESAYVTAFKEEVGELNVNTFTKGDELFVDGVMIAGVWPSALYCELGLNECAISLLIHTNDVNVLTTSDVEFDVFSEFDLPNQVHILKLPHQGSCNDYSSTWIPLLNPRYYVVSVGENSYGHPCKQLLGEIDKSKGLLYRTDYHGSVGFIIDSLESIHVGFK